jgi:DNA-binding NarL/FixJ family response regulator
MHPEAFAPRQTALLGALLDTMRRRLRIERQIASSDLRLVLDHVLDRLGAPAFVIDSNARILAASRSGCALLDVERRELAAALLDALRGSPTRFELTRLGGLESRPCWLAIARADSRDERIAAAIATVAARWGLTPRQRQVLELVVRGTANRTIADALLVTERAIEHHITVLFDRAGVDNRSALVATVLASS